MTREQKTFQVGIGTILSLLLAGNIFFVKRFVDKQDSMEAIVWDLRQQVTILKITIDTMASRQSSSVKKGNGDGETVQERLIREAF